jgi:hypothetical protein
VFAKAVKVRRLAGSSADDGVGIKVGVCVAGPSAETRFLAYLLLLSSGSFAASVAVFLITVHRHMLVPGQRSMPSVCQPGIGLSRYPQLTRQSNSFRPSASTGRPCQGAVYCWRYVLKSLKFGE